MRRYCSVVGCLNVVERGRCAEHSTPFVRQHGVHYGRRWQREARAFLAQPEHIWCVLCPPATTLAVEVDHIEPHRGQARLFWDRSNWQAVCKRCHSAKTARETLRGL